jgi:hypothetical protein
VVSGRLESSHEPTTSAFDRATAVVRNHIAAAQRHVFGWAIGHVIWPLFYLLRPSKFNENVQFQGLNGWNYVEFIRKALAIFFLKICHRLCLFEAISKLVWAATIDGLLSNLFQSMILNAYMAKFRAEMIMALAKFVINICLNLVPLWKTFLGRTLRDIFSNRIC